MKAKEREKKPFSLSLPFSKIYQDHLKSQDKVGIWSPCPCNCTWIAQSHETSVFKLSIVRTHNGRVGIQGALSWAPNLLLAVTFSHGPTYQRGHRASINGVLWFSIPCQLFLQISVQTDRSVTEPNKPVQYEQQTGSRYCSILMHKGNSRRHIVQESCVCSYTFPVDLEGSISERILRALNESDQARVSPALKRSRPSTLAPIKYDTALAP